MNRKLAAHFSWYLAAIALISITGLAVTVVQHVLALVLVAAAVAAGAYAAGVRHGRAGARKAGTRRLEDAQRAAQVSELESLAGRSLDEIIASYRLIARRYQDGPR